jgi:arabinofuranosyltransferase
MKKIRKQINSRIEARFNYTQFWEILILLAGITIFVFLALHYDFVQDDAYISFRYAANFLDGNGLVYNIGERVEGYTNFLWVISLALLKELFSLDFVPMARFLSFISAAMIFVLGALLIRRLVEKNHLPILISFVILLLSCPALPYWTISGLETTAFAFLCFASLFAEYRKPTFTPAILALATLVRPEGGLVFIIILIHRILKQHRFPFSLLFIYLFMLIPFGAFKLYYYGSLIPNPFYAKSGFGLEYIQSGLEYFWQFLSTVGLYGLILLIPLIALPKLWSKYSLLYLFVGIYFAYIILVGGDVLKVYRFFVPVLPVLYLLLAPSLSSVITTYLPWSRVKPFLGQAAVIAFAFIIALSSFAFSKKDAEACSSLERNFTEKMKYTGTMLKKYMAPRSSVAISTIGALGYELMGHRVIDMLGLTDPYIARHPEKIEGMISTWKERRFNSRYLLEQQPDFIIFSTNFKPSAPAERALMLHSEFRNKYSPNGFQRQNGTEWTIYFNKRANIDLSQDRVHPDLTFVNNLNEGLAKLNKMQLDASIKYLEAAAYNLNEEYSLLYFGLGQSFLAQNRLDGSIIAFRRALELDPGSLLTRMMLAEASLRKGDTATANAQLAIVRRLAPWMLEP